MKKTIKAAGKQALAKEQPPKNTAEIGVGGKGNLYFNGEEISFGHKGPSIRQLEKMRKNDGTASALYAILTLPIMSTAFKFVPDPADTVKGADGEDIHPQRDFIEEILTKPPYLGGMTTPLSLVIGDMLRATIQGYRLFEKVYRIDEQGRIVLKKLASREPQTLTLLRDERGGFAGAKQEAFIGQKYETVIIPVESCFLFTFGKEKNNLEGESAFLAAYYHYDKKHRLYYTGDQAAATDAMTLKVIEAPKGATKTDRDNAVDAVDSLGARSTVALPDGYGLRIEDTSSTKDVMPLVDHHDAAMARSVLSQFLMLGTSSGGVGSYALSESHSDIFIMALKGLIRQIEEHINFYLIPDLIQFNFDTPLYPQFKFNDVTSTTLDLLTNLVGKLLDKRPGSVPDWLVGQLLEQTVAQLNIKAPEGADIMHNQDGSPVDNSIAATQQPGNTGPVTQSREYGHKKKVGLADNPNARQWWRPLTPAESKVNFAGIQTKQNQLELDFEAAVKPIFDKIQADAIKRIRQLLEAEDYKTLESFSLKFGDDYVAALKTQMLDAYTYAKKGAADELNKKIPPTPTATKTLISQQAQSIVDKQLSDLNFALKSAITNALRKNQLSKAQLSIGDVLAAINASFNDFFGNSVKLTAGLVISSAINMGRDDVYQTYQDNIQSYQYSAILDDAVCPICESLDGSVVNEADYRSTPWLPPIHFNCRCIWVAIGSDETEPPAITGLPDNPGGVSAPLLSNNLTDKLII